MGRKPELNIIYLSPDKLVAAAENTRLHGEHDISQLMKSIKKYGFNDAIGIWGDENIIVEGHGRVEAAKRLKLETVPCIRLDHLSDNERREYMIMHNRTAELSKWDFKILAEELNEVDMSDFDIDFGIDEISEEGFGEDFTLNDNEVPLVRTITMTLQPEQYEVAQKVIDYFADVDDEEKHTFGNENAQTNNFFEGVYLWAAQKKLV